MTADELRETLDTIANNLQTVKHQLPPPLDDQIISLLSQLDGINLNLILALIKTVNPEMTMDKLKEDIKSAIQMFQRVKEMIQNGDIDRMTDTCKRMQRRRVLLAIVSRMM